MLDQPQLLEYDGTGLYAQLVQLPESYIGPTQVRSGPFSGLAFGEASLALHICEDWINVGFSPAASGTQLILSGGLDFGESASWVDIAEARGCTPLRVGVGPLEDLSFLVPEGPLSTYHYVQYLAHLTGNSAQAEEADQALLELSEKCRHENATENNPAKQLAWKLWTRTPLILASRGVRPLSWGWQQLLARVGKSMSYALDRDPLVLLSGGFEARHESGDEQVGLVIGNLDEEMELCREILETRVDEVLEVFAPHGLGDHAARLYLWYLGVWTSFYLALAYGKDPGDSDILKMLQSPQDS